MKHAIFLFHLLTEIFSVLLLEENMVICFEDPDFSGRCLKGSPSGDVKYATRMYFILYQAIIVFNFCFSSLLDNPAKS